ncbi:MAG: cache domain-containing protein [Pseudomonadota bacterium]
MMEITCGNCGKQYRIDDTKLRKRVSNLKCKACDNAITVIKPGQDPVDEPAAAPLSPLPPPEPPPEPSPEPSPEPTAPSPAARAIGAKKVRFGLTFKVVTIMLLVSLLPFVLFLGLTFQSTRDRILGDTEIIMGETAQGLGQQVDEWLDKNLSALKAASNIPGIQSMNSQMQEPILKAFQQAYPYMYLVFTLDDQGMNVARNDGKPLTNYADRDYYKEIAAGKDVSWQTLIGKTSKKPALVLAVPIKQGDRLVGVMAAAMSIDDISKTVAAWRKGSTGYAFLVDETGKVVAHQIPQYVLTQKKLNDHPLIMHFKQNKRSESVSFTDGDGTAYQGHVRGNKYGWILAMQQSAEEVFAAHRSAERFAFYLLGLTVLLVLFVAYLAGRSITRPINELTDIAERMSMGELNIEIKVKSKDEIGNLAQAIGRMQTSLSMAIERLRRRR